ncbi:hypothetical protein DFH28DRAFT_888384, partial [Melampsora americana]
FPRGADPVSLLPKRYPTLELVQLPGSTLTSESLKLGFDKMSSSTRQLWLNDMNNGVFKLKLKSAPDHTVDTDTVDTESLQGNNHLNEANNTNSPNAQDEVDNDDGEEEDEWDDEWEGIEILSFLPL